MGASRTATWAVAIGVVVTAGCVERKLTINSSPPGALVYLNDQEIGRTPVTRDFTWYGNYDVQIRKEGFQTIKTSTSVRPPVYQWVPIDLFAELIPITFRDEHRINYPMRPASNAPVDPKELLAHGEKMAGMMESSENTKQPATRPTSTTKPVSE